MGSDLWIYHKISLCILKGIVPLVRCPAHHHSLKWMSRARVPLTSDQYFPCFSCISSIKVHGCYPSKKPWLKCLLRGVRFWKIPSTLTRVSQILRPIMAHHLAQAPPQFRLRTKWMEYDVPLMIRDLKMVTNPI